MQSAADSELISLSRHGDLLERRSRHARVQEGANVTEIRVNDSLLNEEYKRLWIIKRRLIILSSAQHLTANPTDVDAKIRPFTQHQVMCVDRRHSFFMGDRHAWCRHSRLTGRWRV